jgi:hypothetical protein
MNEKREAPRFKISQLIGFQANKEEYLWAEGLDISRKGISCVSEEAVDPSTNVFFMLKLSGPEGERTIRGEGYVSHSREEIGKCRFGIKIERIFEEDKPHLEAFLASLEASANAEDEAAASAGDGGRS